MASEFDRLLFEQHLEEVLALPAAKRWSLERDTAVPLGVVCMMYPRTASTEIYKARLRWTDYAKPPSVKFVNVENGTEVDPLAWPNLDVSRPAHFFICAPWTKEGHDHHAEWTSSVTGRYETPEQPLKFALQMLQHHMDNAYNRRGP